MIFYLLLLVLSALRCDSFSIRDAAVRTKMLHSVRNFIQPNPYRSDFRIYSTAGDDLMEMDVVIFSEMNDCDKRQLGAVQDDGRITSLCVWTTEPAFGESLEFLVDEHDLYPGFQPEQIVIHSIVPQNALSYGSRQVGGGMGPGNPHGEESELLYYVERSILTDIELIVKPELETFW